MSTHRVGILILAGAALLSLGGCASSGSSDFVGSWGGDDPSPNITIEDDGRVSGTDGCNRLSGMGSFDGDRFVFGTLAQTKMACLDDAEVIEPWPESARVDGDELVLLDQDGNEVTRLPHRD
ncbi:META domain-containing protein [Leucobacter massiliensis]|uniref:DUF306 domain-containing protein n=1 Tax=Leucobacter massiliensis TaxID=1686285 RepID=A0A2S9QL35_9MICO|nr:META domain-containing protein [Leucobacter massiliensis]PRI10293.1 hypothetical protein B4915_12940 [Leucobacter massiliensis]